MFMFPRSLWLFISTCFFIHCVTAEPLVGADNFQRVPIVTGLANAVDFEVAPDGRIFILNRYGAVTIYDPATQATAEALKLSLYSEIEAGLNGLALDPEFQQNHYLYLFYSPTSPSVNRVSRFTVADNSISIASEVILLNIPVDRTGGNHDGGNMEFDAAGNLYIGVGDDTIHSKYAPLNESNKTRSAEKSASNSQDLRGKILRIHPNSNGTYSIPAGNLFSDSSKGKPEIYIMGARNPYKFSLDPKNQRLFWADIGPDANVDGDLGPAGKDEINLTTGAGNYGWPYFVGPNLPYYNNYKNYYFDPQQPTNDSRWNTGLKILPPAQPAWITKPRSSYMVGPIYRYDSNVINSAKLPPEFDGHLFYWDFNNSKTWYVGVADDDAILREEEWPILSGLGQGYIDFEIGPDHQLYVLEYGTGCCDFDTGNGVLSRIDYIGASANLTPIAKISANKRNGDLPLEVEFSSAGSFDPDSDPINYQWDFDSDGIVDSTLVNGSFTYFVKGTFNAQLKVIDIHGASNSANITIQAGNNLAEIIYNWPPQGGFYHWNDKIDVDIDVVDKEDGAIREGTIDCNSVVLIPALGHLEHAHDTPTLRRCDATVSLAADDHDPSGEDNLYYRLQAGYKDKDGLTSYQVVTLYPTRSPTAFADQIQGGSLTKNTDANYDAVNSVRVKKNSAYLLFKQRNLSNISGVRYRVASSQSGSKIELHTGSAKGPLLAQVEVPNTGALSEWQDIEGFFTGPTDTTDLYVVFKGTPADGVLLDLVSIEYLGKGVSYTADRGLDSDAVSGPQSSKSGGSLSIIGIFFFLLGLTRRYRLPLQH